jgi:predicted dithiol-disulfide oxidoreductase (DUF899 family)
MVLPEVVSRERWLEARLRLLAGEKQETRRRDALNAERRTPSLYALLDLTALGRQEAWEQPKGRAPVLYDT